MSAESPSESDDDGHTESPEDRERRIQTALRQAWARAMDNDEVRGRPPFFWNEVSQLFAKACPDLQFDEIFEIRKRIERGEIRIEDEGTDQ